MSSNISPNTSTPPQNYAPSNTSTGKSGDISKPTSFGDTTTNAAGAVQTITQTDPFASTSTLTMDGRTSTGGLSTTTLLASLQGTPDLVEPNEMSPSEFASLTADVANTLYQNLNPNKDSKGQLSISNPETYQSDDQSYNPYSTPQQTTTSESSGGDGGDTQSTGLSSSSGDTLTFTYIAEMLAKFGVSLSSDLQAQTTALIDAVNATAAAGVAAGQDTINAGSQLLTQAIASFYTSLAFTVATGAVSLGASREGNSAADAETEQQTDLATEQTQQTTLKTEEAINANPADTTNATRTKMEAEASLSRSEAANKPLNSGSTAKQQNNETNDLCKKALKAKQDGKHEEAKNYLAEAKVSQSKANDLINSKSAIASSKEAVAATKKYNEKPTTENQTAAKTANAQAKIDYEKLSDDSPIKANLEATWNHNNNVMKSYTDGTTYNEAYGSSDHNVGLAHQYQANAEQAQPKSVYRANRFSGAGAQAAGQYIQMNMIFGSLGESASNVAGMPFAKQAKTDEGDSQKQSAASQEIGEGTTATNQNIQSMISLIASFQSGSKAAIDAMSTVVSSVKGA